MIHVLERGRIVESGRHDELVAQRGLYHAMWRQQSSERAVPSPSPAAPHEAIEAIDA